MPLSAEYASGPRHGIDIYPARGAAKNGGPAPVLVFLYGGGWTDGRRSLYRFLGRAFAARGFTVAIPDYRLFPEVRFPDFVEDAANALRWVKDNIADYGGDPTRLHLMGHSAGAHIGAMLCLKPDLLGAVGMSPGDIASFTGVSGPYSFNPLEAASVKDIFKHLDDIDTARPIKHAHGEAPPMLLLHSAPDKTVPLRNSQHLHTAVAEAGGIVRHIEYDRVGHIGIILSIAAPLRFLAPVLKDTLAFINSVESEGVSA